MDDLISMLISVLLGVVLLFMIPLCANSSLNESTTSTYVTHQTDVLGDQVCKNGYLSQDMYSDFLSELSNTGLLYDISLVRSHTTIYPVYDNSGNFTGKTKTVDEMTYTDDIIDSLTTQGVYKFKEGDTFSIVVSNRSKTMSQKLFSVIGLRNSGGITSFGGGIVVDENY